MNWWTEMPSFCILGYVIIFPAVWLEGVTKPADHLSCLVCVVQLQLNMTPQYWYLYKCLDKKHFYTLTVSGSNLPVKRSSLGVWVPKTSHGFSLIRADSCETGSWNPFRSADMSGRDVGAAAPSQWPRRRSTAMLPLQVNDAVVSLTGISVHLHQTTRSSGV